MNYKISDVVNSGLCIGCGSCTAKSTTSSMVFNNEGFFVPKLDNSFSNDAIKVCPFNPEPEDIVKDEDNISKLFLKEAHLFNERIGSYINLHVGYSKKFRSIASSGGVASYVFEYLLKESIVDNIFVVSQEDGRFRYILLNDYRQVSKISKTRYFPVTLETLFKNINNINGTVAVSAVPSFVKAIRLQQHYNPKLREKILFIVGIISGGEKSYFFTDYLASKSGIVGEYSNPEYRIKDFQSTAIDYSFGAFNKDSIFYQIKMKRVGNMWGTGLFNAYASDFSDDVSAELADISLGDAWINPYRKDGRGSNVIVTRSNLAEHIIMQGIKTNDLEIENLNLESFLHSQAGAFKHRQMAMKYRLKRFENSHKFAIHKRKRLQCNIPWEYKLVQLQRDSIRKNSILVWKNTLNSYSFDKKMKLSIKKLNFYTKLYHKVQRIRKRFSLGKILY